MNWTIYLRMVKNSYRAYSFQFRLGDVGRRAVYVPLARFLSPDGRQLRVRAMDFYRYLSVHSNLGSVDSIKTGLSRARKWLQENAEGAKVICYFGNRWKSKLVQMVLVICKK